MQAESAKAIIHGFKEVGINFISSLPSSYIGPLIYDIMHDPDFIHAPVANENDCVGLCFGAYLAGKKPAFVTQNSGLFLATYALLDSIYWFSFPMLMVIDHRGDFSTHSGWSFVPYGVQTTRILDSFQVPYAIVLEPKNLKAEIVRGGLWVEAHRKPGAVLLSGEEI